jgi:hypothetical protein
MRGGWCEAPAGEMEEPRPRESGGSTAGAVERLLCDPPSRRRFLKMAGGSAAFASFALFAAACGDDDDDAPSAQAGGDLGIVNYALTLEYIEADFYEQVVRSGILKGRELELAKTVGENERQHINVLKVAAKRLGPSSAPPTTNFEGVLGGGRRRVLRTAAKVENVGAAAYLGQATSIQSTEILATALSIHSVEGRHAAVLSRLAGQPFLPDGALATPLGRSEVLREVQPFLAA